VQAGVVGLPLCCGRYRVWAVTLGAAWLVRGHAGVAAVG